MLHSVLDGFVLIGEKNVNALNEFYEMLNTILQGNNEEMYYNRTFHDNLIQNFNQMELISGPLHELIERMKAWINEHQNEAFTEIQENGIVEHRNTVSNVVTSAQQQIESLNGFDNSNQFNNDAEASSIFNITHTTESETNLKIEQQSEEMTFFSIDDETIDQIKQQHHGVNATNSLLNQIPLNVKNETIFEGSFHSGSGNYTRTLVVEAIGQLEMDCDAHEFNIQAADIQAEVDVVTTTPNIERTPQLTTSRSKRERKPTARVISFLRGERLSMHKRRDHNQHSGEKKRQLDVSFGQDDIPKKNNNNSSNSLNKSMKKRKSSIRQTVSYDRTAFDEHENGNDVNNVVDHHVKKATFKKAKQKQRSETISTRRSTVCGVQLSQTDDETDDEVEHGFARNTNQQMFASNNLYNSLCVFCRKVVKSRLVPHYVTCHPNQEVPISRLSHSMIEKLCLQNEKFQKMNGKIKGLCYFCETKTIKGSKSAMERHILTHTGEKMFHCKTCNERMNSRRGHNSKCKIVNIFEVESIDSSMGYVCKDCNFVQISRESILKHLENEHGFLGPSENHYKKLKFIDF